MLNTDKVRGIMRAKQGSQVPKFDIGGWLDMFLSQNQYNTGSSVPQNKSSINTQLESPMSQKTLVQQQKE